MAVCHVGNGGTFPLSHGIGSGHVFPLTWDALAVRP